MDKSGIGQRKVAEQPHDLNPRPRVTLDGDAAVEHLFRGLHHGRLALRRAVAQHQVAAGGQRVAQRGHGPPGVVRVGDVVQDRDQQQPDRLAEVDQPPGVVVGQDLLRLAQVTLDDRGVLAARQDDPAVCDRDRVDVGVDHPRAGVGSLCHLVHVALGRYARADVEELADPGRAEEPHRPATERAVGPGDRPDLGFDRRERPRHVPVGQEVVAAAEQVVVEPGDVGPPGVDSCRYPVRLAGHNLPP
jgi:hypothetical protein